jgi:hypothetical protein
MPAERRPGRSLPSAAALLFVVPTLFAGCSVLRRDRPATVEVTAPGPVADAPATTTSTPVATGTTRPKKSTPKKNGPARGEAAAKPAALAAPADTIVTTPPPPPPELADAAHRPVVSLVLTEEQKSAKAAQYRTDIERVNLALDSLRGRPLTDTQADQKASAERFLAESRAAFDGNDLPRACSLAEKARVIAEELKSATAPN